MISEAIIQELANKIKRKANPSQLYLFGSYAYGTPQSDSDVDFLVVKPEVNNKWDELLEIKKDIISKDFSVDIVLVSEKEFEEKRNQGWRLFRDIVEKGKKLDVE